MTDINALYKQAIDEMTEYAGVSNADLPGIKNTPALKELGYHIKAIRTGINDGSPQVKYVIYSQAGNECNALKLMQKFQQGPR